MRENLSLESPRSRDNFLRQPQIGAYFTKNAATLQLSPLFRPEGKTVLDAHEKVKGENAKRHGLEALYDARQKRRKSPFRSAKINAVLNADIKPKTLPASLVDCIDKRKLLLPSYEQRFFGGNWVERTKSLEFPRRFLTRSKRAKIFTPPKTCLRRDAISALGRITIKIILPLQLFRSRASGRRIWNHAKIVRA